MINQGVYQQQMQWPAWNGRSRKQKRCSPGTIPPLKRNTEHIKFWVANLSCTLQYINCMYCSIAGSTTYGVEKIQGLFWKLEYITFVQLLLLNKIKSTKCLIFRKIKSTKCLIFRKIKTIIFEIQRNKEFFRYL